jgi:hypothetical protein
VGVRTREGGEDGARLRAGRRVPRHGDRLVRQPVRGGCGLARRRQEDRESGRETPQEAARPVDHAAPPVCSRFAGAPERSPCSSNLYREASGKSVKDGQTIVKHCQVVRERTCIPRRSM